MSKFTDAIERNWPGCWIAPGADCCSDDDASGCEPSFSWHACESCGSKFGGDRHCATAVEEVEPTPAQRREGWADTYSIKICTDCLMFHANGEQPDAWQLSPS